MSEVAQRNTSTSIMVRRVSLVPLYLAPREESLGITTVCGSPHEAGSTRQLDTADKVREEQNRRCMWGSYVIRGRGRFIAIKGHTTTVFSVLSYRRSEGHRFGRSVCVVCAMRSIRNAVALIGAGRL